MEYDDDGGGAGMNQEDEVSGTFAFVQRVAGSGEITIGAAYLGERTRSSMQDRKASIFQLFEFVDCDQFTNLESLLVRLNPSQAFFMEPAESGAKRRLLNVLETVSTKGVAVSSKSFKTDTVEEDLKFLSGNENLPGSLLDLTYAKQAAACLIREMDLRNTGERGGYELIQGKLDHFARLDAAAIDALNLFPTKDGQNIINTCVHSTLNHCKTKKLGARLLSRWIRQPQLDISEIERRQDIVESLSQDTSRRTALQEALKGIPDLESLSRRLESSKAGLKQLYELYLFVKRVPQILACTRDDERGDQSAHESLKTIGERGDSLVHPDCFGKFEGLVETLLDFSLAPREFRVQIQHDKTGELKRLSEELMEVEADRDAERDRLLENELDGMGAKFETDPSSIKTYGFHFRIKKSFDSELKKLKGTSYNYLGVVNAGIRWGTQTLKHLSSSHSMLRSQIDKAQSHLVKEAVTVAATFVPLFEQAAELVSELDVLTSLAHVAAYAPNVYCRPKMIAIDAPIEQRILSLKQARHPCLENQEGIEFIANDYQMDPKTSKFQIITGPNMGGKSTYIRQLGTIVVMAQLGSFVPCEEAQLPIMDAVLARVGASDEQLRGVSTFMAEMVEASAIVKTATKNSLVIIDELGRGTSTYDGFGLAWAISEYLATQLKPYCLFASHFHELTALESRLECVKNKHVTALATSETITMLYSVNDGPCEESFGINVAQMAGFPSDVVQCAKRKAEQLESFTIKAETTSSSGKKSKLEEVKEIVSKFAKFSEEQLQNKQALRQLITC